MTLIVYADGGARGNPGPAGAGVVIATEDGQPLFEAGFFLGRQTNNAAEYMALIHALQRAQAFGTQPLTIRCDTELVVRQITGVYRVKSPKLQALFEQVQMLLLRVPRWHIEHIPREQNSRADELANMAMDRAADVIITDVQSPADSDPPQPDTRPSVEGQSAEAPDEPATRTVRITADRLPNTDHCPAAPWHCEEVFIGATLPGGMCVHAALSLLPTVIAVQSTDPAETRSIPTMTVRCNRTDCDAVFHVCPNATGNGQS